MRNVLQRWKTRVRQQNSAGEIPAHERGRHGLKEHFSLQQKK